MARQPSAEASALKVALFVEGSEPSDKHTRSALAQIWNAHLANALGLITFCAVYPSPRSTWSRWTPTTRR